jgi:oxygen-dependent protoporphyrinogen oxidase
MQQLVDELRSSLTSVDLRIGAEAARIETSQQRRYRVGITNGEAVHADAVIVGAPAFAAAELLTSLAPDTARSLAGIRYASSAVAVLVYDGGDVAIPGYGSGFLVPSGDHRVLSACTWFSKKWPHASARKERLVLRCFVGRAGDESILALDDDGLVDLIDNEVREALDMQSSLESWKLYRWNRGLPIYRVGHLRMLEELEASLERHPGIELAGAGYRGSGIPDCVRQGKEAAGRVLDLVTTMHG